MCEVFKISIYSQELCSKPLNLFKMLLSPDFCESILCLSNLEVVFFISRKKWISILRLFHGWGVFPGHQMVHFPPVSAIPLPTLRALDKVTLFS